MGEFLVYTDGFKSSKKEIKLLYEKWLVRATMLFIERKIDLYLKELGITPQKLNSKSSEVDGIAQQ